MTRVGYCPVCDENQRPKRGQLYIYLNGDSWEAEAIGNTTRGITPHLYLLIRANENFVYYKKICLMVGCGVKSETIDNKQALSIDENKMSGIIKTTTANWNALVMLKDF